jgi:hypothetical protein
VSLEKLLEFFQEEWKSSLYSIVHGIEITILQTSSRFEYKSAQTLCTAYWQFSEFLLVLCCITKMNVLVVFLSDQAPNEKMNFVLLHLNRHNSVECG